MWRWVSIWHFKAYTRVHHSKVVFCKVRVRSVGYEICYKNLQNCRVRVWKSYRTHKTPPGTGNTRVYKKRTLQNTTLHHSVCCAVLVCSSTDIETITNCYVEVAPPDNSFTPTDQMSPRCSELPGRPGVPSRRMFRRCRLTFSTREH